MDKIAEIKGILDDFIWECKSISYSGNDSEYLAVRAITEKKLQSLIAQREATTVGALKNCCDEERDARNVAKTILTEQEVLVSKVSAMRSENEQLKQQVKAKDEALREFVSWNKEYPSSRIYGYGEMQTIIKKLDAINEHAKQALDTILPKGEGK